VTFAGDIPASQVSPAMVNRWVTWLSTQAPGSVSAAAAPVWLPLGQDDGWGGGPGVHMGPETEGCGWSV
jgi:hypothetical protein